MNTLADITCNIDGFVGEEPTQSQKDSFWGLGDVNRDGVIDHADMGRVASLFGVSEGDPNWDPDCDLNGDGTIDISDITIVASNYKLNIGEHFNLDYQTSSLEVTVNNISCTTPCSVTVDNETAYTFTATYYLTTQNKDVTYWGLDAGEVGYIGFYFSEISGLPPMLQTIYYIAQERGWKRITAAIERWLTET